MFEYPFSAVFPIACVVVVGGVVIVGVVRNWAKHGSFNFKHGSTIFLTLLLATAAIASLWPPLSNGGQPAPVRPFFSQDVIDYANSPERAEPYGKIYGPAAAQLASKINSGKWVVLKYGEGNAAGQLTFPRADGKFVRSHITIVTDPSVRVTGSTEPPVGIDATLDPVSGDVIMYYVTHISATDSLGRQVEIGQRGFNVPAVMPWEGRISEEQPTSSGGTQLIQTYTAHAGDSVKRLKQADAEVIAAFRDAMNRLLGPGWEN